MATIQRQALRMFDDRNIGALCVKGFGWVFPAQIREDENVAYAVMDQLTAKAEG